MRNLQAYFDLITRAIEHSGAESVEVEFDQDPLIGTVDGTLFFYDGSRLEFTETITLERYRPVKLSYRYQYVRAGEAMLRYDNAPHHPDLPNFPHHKHVRGERLPATEPTFSQVLGEVASLLDAVADTPQPVPKRRRSKRGRS